MAGKSGMHHRTLNPAAVERLRDKIKSERLIKALEDHVLDGAEMSKSQVSAAVALLRKTVPDLSATELTGADGKDLRVILQVGDADL
jgi:hypothetical protein